MDFERLLKVKNAVAWVKGDLKRIYFNKLEDFYGLTYQGGYYYRDGDKISNNFAREIREDLSAKLWYDFNKGEFCSRNGFGNPMAYGYVDKITKKIIELYNEIPEQDKVFTHISLCETDELEVIEGRISEEQALRIAMEKGWIEKIEMEKYKGVSYRTALSKISIEYKTSN